MVEDVIILNVAHGLAAGHAVTGAKRLRHIKNLYVHVVRSPAGFDAGRAGIDPGEVTDRAIGLDGDGTAGAGGHAAFNVGIADADRVHQAKVRTDVTAGLGFCGVILPVGAVLRIPGIEAIGCDVVSGHVDASLGKHGAAEQRVSRRIHLDAPLEIVDGGRRFRHAEEQPEERGRDQRRRDVTGGYDHGRVHLFDYYFVITVAVHSVLFVIPSVARARPVVG